jgi:type IV secretory pathway TrbF-like protein
VEIWGHLEEQGRFLRWLALGACVWAFLALLGAAIAVEIALTEPLAYRVDESGQAAFIGRLRESAAPSDAEVRYVAKTFVSHYAAVNSLTIESDLAEAWNLMTTELRAQHERMLADYARSNHREFVAFVKEQKVQMLIDWRNDRTRITDHGDKIWTVHLLGTARTWPLSRVGEGAATSERELEAIVSLVRCPRTESTPNGLLVAEVVTRFTVPEEPPGGTGASGGGPAPTGPAAQAGAPEPAPAPKDPSWRSDP